MLSTVVKVVYLIQREATKCGVPLMFFRGMFVKNEKSTLDLSYQLCVLLREHVDPFYMIWPMMLLQ
jgi:hypothetical protein